MTDSTDLDIVQFVRKSFPVDAVKVTEDNLQKVAEWCNGTVRVETDDDPQNAGKDYIKVRVDNPLHERQTKAFVGDWVLYAGKGYKVYRDRAFRKSFDEQQAKNVFDESQEKRWGQGGGGSFYAANTRQIVAGGGNPGGTTHV